MRANDFKLGATLTTTKKKRTNWKMELKLERDKVINEAIEKLRDDKRVSPKSWERGYNSAITILELMKSE